MRPMTFRQYGRRRNRHRLERRRDSLELVGVTSRSPAPILLGFPLHGRRIRVLELEPIVGTTGDVARAKATCDSDVLDPKLLGATRQQLIELRLGGPAAAPLK
jgi:hypothetical protein